MSKGLLRNSSCFCVMCQCSVISRELHYRRLEKRWNKKSFSVHNFFSKKGKKPRNSSLSKKVNSKLQSRWCSIIKTLRLKEMYMKKPILCHLKLWKKDHHQAQNWRLSCKKASNLPLLVRIEPLERKIWSMEVYTRALLNATAMKPSFCQ